MVPYILIALVVAVLMAYLYVKRGPSAYVLAMKAAEEGHVGEIVKAAESLPPQRQSAFYQKAIGFLWENWQRPLAISLVKEYCGRFSDEKICQFWLKKAMEVEPVESRKVLDEHFLETHYRPEVAQACGLTSS